jgi:hypothetical protein
VAIVSLCLNVISIANAVGAVARLPIVTVAAASAAIKNRLRFFTSLQETHSKTDASAATQNPLQD